MAVGDQTLVVKTQIPPQAVPGAGVMEPPLTPGESNHQRQDDKAKSLETTARATLASLMTTSLTDEDWQRTSTRLLEFVAILHAWDRGGSAKQAKSGTPVMREKDANRPAGLDKAA